MFAKMGGWTRLALVLCAVWLVGVTLVASVMWVNLAYRGGMDGRPFAIWVDPQVPARALPLEVIDELDRAFNGPWGRGCIPVVE